MGQTSRLDRREAIDDRQPGDLGGRGDLCLWRLEGSTATAQFFILGIFIALVMGGSQAISRSLFAQMIPNGKEAEFFSFYEISERGTSWIGPLVFGLANQMFGNLRYAILSLIFFFIWG